MNKIFKQNENEIFKISILRDIHDMPVEYVIGVNNVKEVRTYENGVIIIKENDSIQAYWNCKFEYVLDIID